MFDMSTISAFDVSTRFISGRQTSLLIPNAGVNTLVGPNNLRCGIYIFVNATTYFGFGSTFIGPQAGYLQPPGFFAGSTVNGIGWTLDQLGPLIQQPIFYQSSTVGNTITYVEWFDSKNNQGGITPPSAGVRMLKERGRIKDGCYKGIQATEINKMAALINRIRKSPLLNPIKGT